MEIKLGAFNLYYWHTGLWCDKHEITPGIRVCSASNRKFLAVIVDIGPKDKQSSYRNDKELYVGSVQVFWMTGPRKGQRQLLELEKLVNYDAYKQRLAKELKELEDNEAESAKTGM